MISLDEFKKVEITVGKVLSAKKVPETEKLLKLSVDFGNKGLISRAVGEVKPFGAGSRDVRQIISGIAAHFSDAQMLVGKKCMFVTNLKPRVIRGLKSNGMLLAVSTEDGKFSLLEPSAEIPEGTRAR